MADGYRVLGANVESDNADSADNAARSAPLARSSLVIGIGVSLILYGRLHLRILQDPLLLIHIVDRSYFSSCRMSPRRELSPSAVTILMTLQDKYCRCTCSKDVSMH